MTYDEVLDIFKHCELDGELSEENYPEKICDYLPETFLSDCKVSSGATKLVFIPKNENFVIKIPFNGWQNDDYSSTTSYNSSNYDTIYSYTPFVGANDDLNHCWDYCYTEMALYKLAKRNHLAQIFIKNKLIGFITDESSYNKHPIYVQKKVVPLSQTDSSVYRSQAIPTSETIMNFCRTRGYHCFNVHWLTDFLLWYGEDMLDHFFMFLRTYGLNDLHNGNIGYLSFNDRPVLLDYGGWNW